MDLTIERTHLLKALQHVQSVVERRNTIPILSNVLLSADADGLGLLATDLDIAIADKASATVGQTGATTAPAHMLFDIVRKLPDGTEVALRSAGDSDRLELQAGNSQFTLLCLPTDDFPAMAEGTFSHNFAIPLGDLKRLIDKTRFAISTEETRYYLNGIFLHAAATNGSATLRAVATDGHRLARVESPLPAGAEGMPGIIVPRKAVLEIRKLLEEAEGDIVVALSDTKIRFTVGDAVLISKLIDGTFPDYERVIPSGNDKAMTVIDNDFAAAIDRVATIANDKSRAVKFTIDDGRLVLSANSPEQASASEELVVDYDGDAMDIGFNSRYVLDMAQQIDGENLTFSMHDAASPTIVTDPDDPSALYVLMPMRV